MKRTLRIIAATLLLTLAHGAHAQNSPGGNPGGGNSPGGNPENCTGLCNPLNGVSTLPEFLRAILKGIVEIGTIILIMMLVYVGFLFVMARGNAEKLQGAKSALVWTVIGGLILLGATAIEAVISGTVGAITAP
ncbi:MAG TPA: hypothetical protein VGE23_01790 [Candidatus Paceibacterota bacterium]